MDRTAKQASLVIDSVAKAVANWTVDEHARLNPEMPNLYGRTWRTDWIGHTLAQLHMLAQAVAVRSAELFVNSVRWTHESFEARGIMPADLQQNAQCMREILEKELPPTVSKTALSIIDASLNELHNQHDHTYARDASASAEKEVVLQYLTAILESDRVAAESIVLATLDRGVSVPEIYENILAPAQVRLGQMWHRGEISVADEHFGSATTRAVMSQLRPRFKRSDTNGRLVVGTSTPGDLHEIGLQMVVDLFEMDGWSVVYLGANTPIADVIELLKRRKPNLLALSVSTALMLRDAGELIESVRADSDVAQTKLLIGGPPFKSVDGLWQELGADGCACSSTEAVKVGNTLVAG
ncbi:MAG: hypothetical protein DHS20C16_09660 [Phycisphaerae bacterium]|nr:MAG: hypothetical protein DHS20C16_09660 [Phycisphaerae bacterium]